RRAVPTVGGTTPAGKTQFSHPGLGRNRASEPQHHFLGYRLDRGREIHLALREPDLRLTWGPAEQGVEAVIRHRQARAVIEIGEVKSEGAVGLKVDQVLEDGLCETRLAIR